MIPFFASRRNYLDHLAPIWLALPLSARGPFRLPVPLHDAAAAMGIPASLDDVVEDGLAVVASFHDYLAYTRGPVVFVEHGVGQVWQPPHQSGPGGPGRDRVALFLSPSPAVAALNARLYPSARHEVVGMPSMDSWPHTRPRRYETSDRELPGDGPLVVIVKWDNAGVGHPGARWAWPDHRAALEVLPFFLSEGGYPFPLFHAHPRAQARVFPWAEECGYEVVATLEEVARQARAVICDNSSAAFQLAALGCPVGWLESATYPGPSVNLPPRFTSLAYLLPVLRPGGDLLAFVEDILTDRPEAAAARRLLVASTLPLHDGGSAARAAAAILTLRMAVPA